MAEQILPYTVILGDWSDDGHGKTEKSQIEFFTENDSIELTEKLIVDNYRANVEKLGFGLPELWSNYEESTPSNDKIEKLRDVLGAVYYSESSKEDFEDGVLPFGSFYTASYGGKTYIESDGDSLDIAMFLVLAGLPDVHWRTLSEPPVLFGGYGTPLVGSEHVGYGLFY